MKLDDVMKKVLEIFPGCEIAEDNDGQLVIYTNMKIFSRTEKIEYLKEFDKEREQ